MAEGENSQGAGHWVEWGLWGVKAHGFNVLALVPSLPSNILGGNLLPVVGQADYLSSSY